MPKPIVEHPLQEVDRDGGPQVELFGVMPCARLIGSLICQAG